MADILVERCKRLCWLY